MISGMRRGAWNYRGKEAIQAWTLPSVSPLQVFSCQWEVTLENTKNRMEKQNTLGNIQFQELERRTEEDPEAEFLTSRRILRDISATLIPAGSGTSWQEMLQERKDWREMFLSKLGLINALGTMGLLSDFAVCSYSPICPWQQVKNMK